MLACLNIAYCAQMRACSTYFCVACDKVIARGRGSADGGVCRQVETIGDAYMVVSGAPQTESNHAEKVCDMALDMVEAITDLKDPSTGLSLTSLSVYLCVFLTQTHWHIFNRSKSHITAALKTFCDKH